MEAGEPGAKQHRLIVIPWLRPVGQRFLLPSWLAITLGRWVVSWRPLDAEELAHELAHVGQWQRYGPRFIALYLRASARAAAQGLDRYRDNVFEIEARLAGDAARSRRGANGGLAPAEPRTTALPAAEARARASQAGH